LRKHPIRRLSESLRRHGVLETLKSAARIIADYRFDLKYGTDTMQQVEVDSLDTNSGNKAHARRYQASKARPLLKLFRTLALPADKVFVDMGCGKGRVLLLASQFGFRRVVGLEFSALLCRKAEMNIAQFSRRNARSTVIEVVETDIALYEFKEDENVFFLCTKSRERFSTFMSTMPYNNNRSGLACIYYA
jgi:tRNA1(Val) A37 N6-methylase TrmN6